MSLTMSSTPQLLFAPFRVEPEPVVRRMAFWFFLAGLLPLLLMVLLCILAINPWSIVSRIALLSLILWGVAIFYATYHQHVDNDGIWECALLFRHGWRWNRFTLEHIYRANNDFFDDKAKWWQSDHCSLERLSEQQRTEVLEHIHALWRPPALPEQLQLNTFWGWHRSLETTRNFKFSADGVVLDNSADTAVVELLPWSEVRSIDVIRVIRNKSVPSKLMVRFRNARETLPFYLHEIDKRTHCQIEPCLLKWSLPGTVHMITLHGPIKSLHEAIYRKMHYRKQIKDSHVLTRIFVGSIVFLIILMSSIALQSPINHVWDVVKVATAIAIFPLLLSLLAFCVNLLVRDHKKQLQEAEVFIRQLATVVT